MTNNNSINILNELKALVEGRGSINIENKEEFERLEEKLRQSSAVFSNGIISGRGINFMTWARHTELMQEILLKILESINGQS